MNLSQKEIDRRFENFRQKIGIAEIIESKSLISMIKAADSERLPISHEKILFSTIAHETKILSALGHFEPALSIKDNKLKETQNQEDVD